MDIIVKTDICSFCDNFIQENLRHACNVKKSIIEGNHNGSIAIIRTHTKSMPSFKIKTSYLITFKDINILKEYYS